jgi:hypothetical protein
MRVLVGCEFSGTVRRALRAIGHDAWSCDLLDAADADPHHIKGDVLAVLDQCWDAAIFHPPCTYLTSAAEWAYGDGPYHQRVKPGTLVGAARRAAREDAIRFVEALWAAPIHTVVIENPVGCLSRRWVKPTQIVQPHQFGDDASKATCLWIRGAPPLTPTRHVPPRIVGGKPRWGNQTDNGQNRLSPSDDRWAKRSITYPGIAEALAQQIVGCADEEPFLMKRAGSKARP